MSEQTDALLGLTALDAPDKEAELLNKEAHTKSLHAARERYRVLRALQAQPGYAIVQEALQLEIDDTFRGMARTDNPITLAKASGMHYAATMAKSYVEDECKRLHAFLIQNSK